MSPDEYHQFLRASFEDFLQAQDRPLEPNDPYLPFSFPYITTAKWRFMADAMIQDELRELTNRLHDWRDILRRWHAWNIVSSSLDEMRAWDLRREFMDPLMHTTLLTPSSMRDVFTLVGTNAFHQLRLHIDKSYPDVLEGDPSVLDPRPRELNRRQKEDRLRRLAASIPGASAFLSALREIDSEAYRTATKNYRNANSHAIGPRITLGSTRMVTRRVVQATRIEAQPDGTRRLVDVAGKYVASYSFGGVEPLDLETARAANLSQYRLARTCFASFTCALEANANTLPRADA